MNVYRISITRAAPFLLVAAIALFLRLWQLDLAQFQDIDDVRDWKRTGFLLRGKEQWWMGPDAALSTGHGARLPGGLYYQLLAAAYKVNPSPVSGLALAGLLGAAAAGLTVFVARLFMAPGPAVLAGLLAATSPIWVLAGRRISNPSFLLFFSLLFYWGVALWLLKKSRLGLFATFACAGLLFQLHLSSLMIVPLLLIAGFTGLRKPRTLILGIAIGMLPLVPFFVSDAKGDWIKTKRLSQAISQVVNTGQDKEGRELPKPICWPLPYLPPLATCGYSDEFIDRAVAELLLGDSSELLDTGLLGLYWKTGFGKIVRSFSLWDIPKRVKAHNSLTASMRVRFWADTVASLILLAAIILGFLGLVRDSWRGDRGARILLLLSGFLLLNTLLSGSAGTYHFYFIFFPIPALVAARSAFSAGPFRRFMSAILIFSIAVQCALLIDKRVAIGKLGGTPNYGVAFRSRQQAAQWLESAGSLKRHDVSVVGGLYAWRFLLKRGGVIPKFKVVEIGALDALCDGGPEECGAQWLAFKERIKPSLVYDSKGIWIYRIGDRPPQSVP